MNLMLTFKAFCSGKAFCSSKILRSGKDFWPSKISRSGETFSSSKIFRSGETFRTGLILICALTAMSACSEENLDQEKGVTTQGTVELGTIKLGTSDQVFQEASVTFVRDQSASANSGGKRQYLSRGDIQGGQYMVQVKDGSCFEITIIYKDKPVSREAAESAMKGLLPEGAPAQSRVDDPGLNQAVAAANQNFLATYYFGEDYLGDMSFTDKTETRVKSLKVFNILLLKQALADSQAQKESLKPLVDKQKQEADSTGH
jgi:hypothetical protein